MVRIDRQFHGRITNDSEALLDPWRKLPVSATDGTPIAGIPEAEI